MSSTRLTKYQRQEIRKRLLAGRFDKALDQLRRDHAKLADMTYVAMFSVHDRQTMSAVPAGWLFVNSDISLQVGDSSSNHISLHFNGRFDIILGREYVHIGGKLEPENRPRPYSSRNNPLKVEEDTPIGRRFFKLKADIDALKTEHDQLWHQVVAVLNSCTTVERLIKVWPHAAAIIADVTGEVHQDRQLPVVQIEELSAALGLKRAA